MAAYAWTNDEYRSLKEGLARVIATGSPEQVVLECDRVLQLFEVKGFPDSWMDWERAKMDALFAIQRADSRWP